MIVVRWTKPAADDLTTICDYTLARFGPAQARRMALKIYKAADSLRVSPYQVGRDVSPKLGNSSCPCEDVAGIADRFSANSINVETMKRLMATDKHGFTQIKTQQPICYPCSSVCIRGQNVLEAPARPITSTPK